MPSISQRLAIANLLISNHGIAFHVKINSFQDPKEQRYSQVMKAADKVSSLIALSKTKSLLPSEGHRM